MFLSLEETETVRDSSTSLGMTKKLRRAHEEHGDHAAEKCQQREGGDSEDDQTRWIARCRSLPERGSVSETGRRGAGFGGGRFNFFELWQGLRAANIRLEMRFDCAEPDSIFEM